MSLKLKKWDTAERIQSDADGRLLLEEIAREGSAVEIAHGIDALARARGMSLLAQELGISPTALFELINPWDDKFEEHKLHQIAERLARNHPADAAE
jgi:probable addiction module antidote protein